MLKPILIHIFGPRRNKACCPIFVFFCKSIFNVFCDLVLHLLDEGLNIPLIYYDRPVSIFKKVLGMQNSALPKYGSQYIFLSWIAAMRDWQGRYNQKRIRSFCGPWSLRFRFFFRRENHNVDSYSKLGWIKALQGNLLNQSVEYLFCL